MTNAQFIQAVYANVLYRPQGSPTAPNAGEIGYWNDRLVSGADTKGTMVLTMLHDVHAYFETDPVYGFVAQSLNNKAFVAKCASRCLKREASLARARSLAAPGAALLHSVPNGPCNSVLVKLSQLSIL